MNYSLFFTFVSFFYSFLLLLIFFSKKRFKSAENNIYSILVVSNFIGIIIEIMIFVSSFYRDSYNIFYIIFSRGFLIYVLTWTFLFTTYVLILSFKEKQRKPSDYKILYIVLGVIYSVSAILLLFLPLYNQEKNGVILYTYGPSVNVIFVVSFLCIVVCIFSMLVCFKSLKSKKYYPLMFYTAMGFVISVVQTINPSLLLTTANETFVTFLMFFTIENPDLKVIDELKKNKELVEKSNIEKSNFLFRMSQEVREPLNSIRNLNKVNMEINEVKEMIKNSKLIDLNARQLSYIINNVLDVSSLDAKKIKAVTNEKYNIYKLFDEIKLRTSKKINKNIDYRVSVSDNIPECLIGDSIKLKQVIITIITNAIENTKEGFIEVNVDSINKYDVCRLIVSISDSGKGIGLEKVNDLLSVTGELSVQDEKDLEQMNMHFKVANKVIKLLGGTIMIKSEEKKGSEFIVVLDQIICNKEKDKFSKQLEKYEEEIYNDINILIVDDNVKTLKELSLLFDDYNVTTSMYGKDCIGRIKNGEKFNLIILSDDMRPMSGISTLNELKKIDGFDVPVIVTLDNSKKTIKHHYIEEGFCDYILKDKLKTEVSRIIKKML